MKLVPALFFSLESLGMLIYSIIDFKDAFITTNVMTSPVSSYTNYFMRHAWCKVCCYILPQAVTYHACVARFALLMLMKTLFDTLLLGNIHVGSTKWFEPYSLFNRSHMIFM